MVETAIKDRLLVLNNKKPTADQPDFGDLLLATVGSGGADLPGELSTKVPHNVNNLQTLRIFLKRHYRVIGLKEEFKKKGKDMICLYGKNNPRVIVGVGLAAAVAVGWAVVYQHRRSKG